MQAGVRCCEPGPAPLSTEQAEAFNNDLQILAHPIRLQLLALLARHEGQACVCVLQAAVSVKQPTVSHHLKLLRDAGLIDCEKQGLWAYYFIRRAAVAALRARITGQLEGLL